MILDDGSNRWYDKTLQIVVFKSGKAGIYAEHSLIDATVVSRVLTDVLSKIEPSNLMKPKSKNSGVFKRVEFNFSPRDYELISTA
jgi:hypothetical protein